MQSNSKLGRTALVVVALLNFLSLAPAAETSISETAAAAPKDTVREGENGEWILMYDPKTGEYIWVWVPYGHPDNRP